MDSIKETYHKKNFLDKELNAERVKMAEREIQTFSSILQLSKGLNLNQINTVVDLGCGDKFLKKSLEAHKISYQGYDVNDLNLESERIPLEDNSTDLVISLALIEHLKDPSNFLQETLRILKPGSSLILSTPNWRYSRDVFYDDYTHVQPYTVISLTNLLKDMMFSEIYDFPNLRCKNNFSYTNRIRYFLAFLRPFSNNSRFSKFLPSFLKGRSKGMFILGKKPSH